MGDFGGAVSDAQAVLKTDPKDPVAMAVQKLSTDRVPGQIKLPNAPAEQSNLPELAMLAGRETGTKAKSADDLKRAKQFLEKGEAAMAAGDYPAMHRFASISLSIIPENPQAYVQRAFANLFLHRPSGMVADATLGLALSPDSPELLGLRARGYNELANYDAAFADADRAIALNPKHAMGWSERARAREGLRQPAQAWLDDYKRAAELQPAWSNLYDEALARSQGRGLRTVDASPPWRDPVKVISSAAIVLVVGMFLFGLFTFRTRGEAAPSPAPNFGPPPAPAAAKSSERYELGRLLGQGGMGKVYEAKDTLLHRPVAIKRIREELMESPQDMKRFFDEARTVASLAHPNIVAIYDVVEDGPWLVFELVNGRTLQHAIDAAPGQKLDPAIVRKVVEQVCAALDHAHARKVVHRDLKPSNVMINDGLGVKVMDFGISRVAKDSLMRTTATIAGTPLYMAPEQESGKAQRETDLYALGICAFEMLAGFTPFQGPAQLDLKKSGKIAASGLSAKADAFFARALSPDPASRFHSGGEFLAAFQDAC
ncbi:MAG: serine/threonine protein kinase [Elusimicrobia bacterium]|nr:serine/threonine protein kinase [Elusimicrobiota bacterium]